MELVPVVFKSRLEPMLLQTKQCVQHVESRCLSQEYLGADDIHVSADIAAVDLEIQALLDLNNAVLGRSGDINSKHVPLKSCRIN